MAPLVSVCIPCYNNAPHVAQAVESALAQTHVPLEVVVVDDGSSDNSVEVLRGFGDRIIFEAGPNRGACAARNRALALSHGEYVNFLDADDLLVPHKIEAQLPFLVNDEADLVFCKGYIFGDHKTMRPKKQSILNPTGIDPFVYCLSQGLSTEGPLHRRALVERVGGFRVGVPSAQETDLHLRLAASGARIRLLEELLYQHRNHAGQRISNRPRPPAQFLHVLLELAQLLEQPPYQMTPKRWQALADTIHQQSIYTFRGGAEAEAASGFARARQISPKFRHPRHLEGALYGVISSVAGPIATEKFFKAGRQFKRKLRPRA